MGKRTYLVEVFKKCFEKTSLFPVYMCIISGGTAGAKRYDIVHIFNVFIINIKIRLV